MNGYVIESFIVGNEHYVLYRTETAACVITEWEYEQIVKQMR